MSPFVINGPSQGSERLIDFLMQSPPMLQIIDPREIILNPGLPDESKPTRYPVESGKQLQQRPSIHWMIWWNTWQIYKKHTLEEQFLHNCLCFRTLHCPLQRLFRIFILYVHFILLTNQVILRPQSHFYHLFISQRKHWHPRTCSISISPVGRHWWHIVKQQFGFIIYRHHTWNWWVWKMWSFFTATGEPECHCSSYSKVRSSAVTSFTWILECDNTVRKAGFLP